MNIYASFALLLFCHFLADFILQPSWMAKRKSEDVQVLLAHVAIHYAVFVIGIAFILGTAHPGICFLFSGINAVLHGIIDWNVWRGYKRYASKKALVAGAQQEAIVSIKGITHKDGKLELTDDAEPVLQPSFKWWEDHYFYVTIGADQMLHGLSIILALWIVGTLG